MIKTIIEFITHADTQLALLVQNYGDLVYAFLSGVIFLETGFVLTPFLPGDSLLFLAGTFAATGALNVYLLLLLLSLAAILGDTVNYWIGRYFGERIFVRFVKQEHLERTKLFFDRYGKKTIVLARFVPIIRTFAPFVAGIARMQYRTFLAYNVIGGIVWVALFLFAGFYFGAIPFVKDNLTSFVLFIIIVSLLPVAVEYAKHRMKKV